MNKKLLILVLGLLLSINTSFANRYVTQTYTTPLYNPNVYNTQANLHNINSAKLSQVEQTIYGRTYENQNPNTRLNRLERSIFNKTYPNQPFEHRINNLMMNYNNNYNNHYSTVSNKTNKFSNLINNLNGMMYGVPTGFTPQINTYNGYGIDPNWGHQQGYYGNRGWYNQNRGIGSGMGIRILD